jgi:hypothetical protein
MENGKQPAFSKSVFDKDGNITAWGIEYDGLTKREYFAGLAMQGLISSVNWEVSLLDDNLIKITAIKSTQLADELLKQLDNIK